MKGLRVIGDKILAKVADVEKEDTGAIFIPDSGIDDVVVICEVVDNGNIDADVVPVGSNIYFNKYSAAKLTFKNNEYYVVGVKDILAIY